MKGCFATDRRKIRGEIQVKLSLVEADPNKKTPGGIMSQYPFFTVIYMIG